jgi:hypothetical protein
MPLIFGLSIIWRQSRVVGGEILIQVPLIVDGGDGLSQTSMLTVWALPLDWADAESVAEE